MNAEENNLVSVIIPCYNQGHFLREAIESALRQTYAEVEILVVDDGSTDDTALIATSYARVRCLRQKNGGLSLARNTGMRASRGEFLVFLDADDRLLPRALEIGVNSLRERQDCAFAYGHVELIGKDGAALLRPRQIAVLQDHYLELLRKNYIWTPGAVVYRRQALEATGGFKCGIDACADYELNLRLARLFPVCCHDQTILEYRKYDGNMSTDAAHMMKTAISALRGERPFIDSDERRQQAWREGLKEMRWGYGEKLITQVRDHLRAGQWWWAMRATLTLLRYHPKGAAKAYLPEYVIAGLRRLRSHSLLSNTTGI